MQASILVECNEWQDELPRIWRSIGYDEINWTYTPRGKALYRTLHELAEAPYFVRNHNGLTSGNGLSAPAAGSTNVYHEMPDGTPFYSWEIVDRVYDTYVGSGFIPLIELGFLPYDLVPRDVDITDWARDVGKESYENDGHWKLPPKDYERWAELVYQFVHHCVERYGAAEVARWRFELWNEPDIPHYWLGTPAEYCKLYDYTVDAATRALPAVQMGGPASTSPGNPAAGAFLAQFLDHCVHGTNAVTSGTGTRLDFISYHTKGAHYARRRIYNPKADVPKESPSSFVMMNDIRSGLEIIARYPELRGIPVLVDECDPAVGTIYGVYDNPSFVVTNSEYYPTFLCALVKRILDLNRAYPNPIELITTWAFYMEGKRYFEGNRTLVTNQNIEKPILNAFRMLAAMGHTRVKASSDRARDVLAPEAPPVEVDALAAVSGRNVTVLVWHQADEWWSDGEGEAEVELCVERVPFAGAAQVRHFRIDATHSNAYAAWVAQGEPQEPSAAQLVHLRRRQGLELLEPPREAPADGNAVLLRFRLPLQGTSLIEIQPAG